ncbi:hypothetical protein [Streptomyces sp. NPDC057702]|uniref:hypothetical protein n=1 Tax=unclassified Streptomyces TaxID=2593676 RepID=UPI0036AB1D44
MSLNHPEESSGHPSESTTHRARLSWIDLVLLVVVLGALVTLLALGVALAEAVAVVGVAGLVTAEMRRRFSET